MKPIDLLLKHGANDVLDGGKYVDGIKEARRAYAQAWVDGSGEPMDDVELTIDFLRAAAAELRELRGERLEHTHSGNCWEDVHSCDDCGQGNMCDVCHDHHEARGECDSCPRCPACEATS